MSDFGHRSRRKRSIASLVSAALLAGVSFQAHALENGSKLSLQGVFCNTEDQVDKAVAHMANGLAPNVAVNLVNLDDVVCNYVDRIHYVVESPMMVGAIDAGIRFFKYEATLKAISVGGALREVSPPVQIFFVTPRALTGVSMAKRA